MKEEKQNWGFIYCGYCALNYTWDMPTLYITNIKSFFISILIIFNNIYLFNCNWVFTRWQSFLTHIKELEAVLLNLHREGYMRSM